jgi:gliding motility-associated-like protein
MLESSGGVTYLWSPDLYINNIHIPNPVVYPPESMNYTLVVTDEKGCAADSVILVYVQYPPDLQLADSTIIVGEYIEIDVPANMHVDYIWTPAEGLACPHCPNPGFQPMHDQQYVVEIFAWAEDKLCYHFTDTIFFEVIWEFTVDVPSVFTPNGDGVNDLVLVDGWGVKEVLEFSIYNRWGELVFRSEDLNTGWDGKYKSQDQPQDTYVYFASVKTFAGQTLTKRGTLTLIR